MKKLAIIILIVLSFCRAKTIKPSGTYLFISQDYEFEQILVFKQNYEVDVFEKNHYYSKEKKTSNLLEKYTVYWIVQNEKLCYPLEMVPSNPVNEKYCQDYYIDNNQLIFFEPGLGDEISEIKFIKISDK